MLEAHHFTAAAKRKGSYALPEEFDGRVHRAVLWESVRAYRNNQRQGTHSTKTRGEVSGGNRKPWRQKGTGRARQGSIRSAQWRGGGIIFGPRPRDYRTDLPRKVRRLARQSALNARAGEGALYVIEDLAFDSPKTRQMVELLGEMELADRKVLVLTAENREAVYLSGRNLPKVRVLRYADASVYDILWSDAIVVEEAAIGGHAVAGKATSRTRRSTKQAEGGARPRAGGRALSKKRATAKKVTTTARKKATKKKTPGKRKSGDA